MTDIQKVILNIFKDLQIVFKENNLRYFAIGGTCLGAVRHKGFIPWDDDIDIAMPIDDYVRFLDIAPKVLPSHLELFIPENHKHCPLLFIKVCDKRTTAVESQFLDYKDSYMGIWVDLMPLCGVPTEGLKRILFMTELRFIKNLSFACYEKYPRSEGINSKLAWLCRKTLKFFIPRKCSWKLWIHFLKSYPFGKYEHTGYVWNRKFVKNEFPVEWFNKTEKLKFEDTFISCPAKYEFMLTKMFGDYMALPSENCRKSGHEFSGGIIDLKRPYTEYQ